MKRFRLAILLLLIPLCCVAFAALSKTSTIEESEVDPWQKVLAGTLAVGNVGDISNSYRAIVYLVIAYADTDTQDGVRVKIEGSYGDDTWILLKDFTTPSGTSETTILDGAVFDADVIIQLIDGSKFDTNGRKWFIEDSTPGNSESVRTRTSNVNEISICKDLLRGHDSGSSVWDEVHEFIIPIPASFAAFRITIHDIDANADIYFTTRMSKVKEL